MPPVEEASWSLADETSLASAQFRDASLLEDDGVVEDASVPKVIDTELKAGAEAGAGSPSDGGTGVAEWRLDPKVTFSDWTIQVRTTRRGDNNKSDSPDDDEAQGLFSHTPVLEEDTLQQQQQQQHYDEEQDDDGTTLQAYSVHKTRVAVGPRRSEFFTRLFAPGGPFEGATRGISHFTLPPTVARAFPVLLDYVYEGTLEALTTENVVPLEALARCMQIPALRNGTETVWRRALTQGADGCVAVYRQARRLRQPHIAKPALRALTQRYVMDLTPPAAFRDAVGKSNSSSSSARATRGLFCDDGEDDDDDGMDAMLWTALVRSRPAHVTPDGFGQHASQLVAAATQRHVATLEPELFRRLVEETHMPVIHPRAALVLLETERRILSRAHGDGDRHDRCPRDPLLPQGSLSLRERCVTSLSTHWRALDATAPPTTDPDRPEASSPPDDRVAAWARRQQHPALLADLWTGTLKRAQEDHRSFAVAQRETSEELQDAQASLRRMQHQLTETKETLEAYKKKLAETETRLHSETATRHRYESTLSHLHRWDDFWTGHVKLEYTKGNKGGMEAGNCVKIGDETYPLYYVK